MIKQNNIHELIRQKLNESSNSAINEMEEELGKVPNAKITGEYGKKIAHTVGEYGKKALGAAGEYGKKAIHAVKDFTAVPPIPKNVPKGIIEKGSDAVKKWIAENPNLATGGAIGAAGLGALGAGAAALKRRRLQNK